MFPLNYPYHCAQQCERWLIPLASLDVTTHIRIGSYCIMAPKVAKASTEAVACLRIIQGWLAEMFFSVNTALQRFLRQSYNYFVKLCFSKKLSNQVFQEMNRNNENQNKDGPMQVSLYGILKMPHTNNLTIKTFLT